MLLAAVDDRLACAAVSSGNTENVACAGFLPPGSTDDAEQDFIGSGPLGFDRWDTLYPIAPKPLLVLASAKDSFGTYSPNYMTNGREEFAKLRRFYEVLGAGSKVEWGETPDSARFVARHASCASTGSSSERSNSQTARWTSPRCTRKRTTYCSSDCRAAGARLCESPPIALTPCRQAGAFLSKRRPRPAPRCRCLAGPAAKGMRSKPSRCSRPRMSGFRDGFTCRQNRARPCSSHSTRAAAMRDGVRATCTAGWPSEASRFVHSTFAAWAT